MSRRGPYSCDACGETWETDPREEVECPVCHAQPGQRCKRPSGHPAMEPHVEREQVAVDRGLMSICSAAPTSPTVKRVDLFGNITDTYQTEAELNGFRQSQGRLFG